MAYIDVKKKLNDPGIVELLEYSLQGDSDRLESTVLEYRRNPYLHLYGIESEDEVIGVIGYRHTDSANSRAIAIEHLAVRPDCRGGGYGRGLILELIEHEKPDMIFAETDDDAVEFFRNIGFTVESMGEPVHGVERFRCSYQVDDGE